MATPRSILNFLINPGAGTYPSYYFQVRKEKGWVDKMKKASDVYEKKRCKCNDHCVKCGGEL